MQSTGSYPSTSLKRRKPSTEKALALISERESLDHAIILDGENLSIAQVTHVFKVSNIHVDIPKHCLDKVRKNALYLREKLASGSVVYGVNTGYGGSGDVRCQDIAALKLALLRMLNIGFGEVFEPALPRAVMLIRANSLCKAMSAVRPEVIQMICQMIREDIIPVVPKRGSVSASGDLVPMSYIACAMRGRPDCKVVHRGNNKTAKEALSAAGLKPMELVDKEALAILNCCSFSCGLASKVLYYASSSLLLTQVCVAMSVEALTGRKESFHETIHQCMPHPGQCEVAENILHLLQESKMCISQLDMHLPDQQGMLKQDRYALRTSAQWLGPAVEMLQRAIESVEIDLNSANDNPLVDHRNDRILNGGNFQGTAITVAMDTTRQAVQLCGKLLFALMSELVNSRLNNNLPPNLSGSDWSQDFGFKGMDIAMTSYMSELDLLTSPVTRHVLSAEMSNQSVNSLALLSARWSEQALTILQQMLANISVPLAQALDLRWLQGQVNVTLSELSTKHVFGQFPHDGTVHPHWYEFAFNPSSAAASYVSRVKTIQDPDVFVTDVTARMAELTEIMRTGKHVDKVEEQLGRGTRHWYHYIRKDLLVNFYHGDHFVDTDLQKIFPTITEGYIENVLIQSFPS